MVCYNRTQQRHTIWIQVICSIYAGSVYIGSIDVATYKGISCNVDLILCKCCNAGAINLEHNVTSGNIESYTVATVCDTANWVRSQIRRNVGIAVGTGWSNSTQ